MMRWKRAKKQGYGKSLKPVKNDVIFDQGKRCKVGLRVGYTISFISTWNVKYNDGYTCPKMGSLGSAKAF